MIGLTQQGIVFVPSGGLGQAGCRPVTVLVRPPGSDPNRPQQREFNPCLDDPETWSCAILSFFSDDRLIRCVGDALVANYRARIDQLIDWQRRNIADWDTAWGLFRLITQSARDWLILRRHRLEKGNILIPFGPVWGLRFYIDALTRTRDEGIARLKSVWLAPYPGTIPEMPSFEIAEGKTGPTAPTGSQPDSWIDRFSTWIKDRLGLTATVEQVKTGILIGSLALGGLILILLLRRR